MPPATRLRLHIRGGAPLRGAIALPPDLPIARAAVFLAALADGETRLAGALQSAQLRTLIGALRGLGVAIDSDAEHTRIAGVGLRGFALPAGAIDCGRSLDLVALFAGALCGQSFGTRLTLAAHARSGSLAHLVGALQARGVPLRASGRDASPPLAFAPRVAGEPLRAIECALPEPDPRAKAAVLISGLVADGPTAVAEPLLSADHVERMLSACGVGLKRAATMTALAPVAALTPLGPSELPGCSVLGAAIACAAAVIPGSRIALHDLATNPTRSGTLDALRLFGARMLVASKGERAGHEPVAELQIQHGALRGGVLSAELALHAGDALPSLCLLGARAARGVRVLDAEAYAAQGAPDWTALVALVRAFGAQARVAGAGIEVEPAAPLRGANVDVQQDDRLALCAVLFGLAADGETTVEHADTLDQDYPALLPLLQALGAQIEQERVA
jgi:3-phosphoshikimate 1-carboxyvinyltransferase